MSNPASDDDDPPPSYIAVPLTIDVDLLSDASSLHRPSDASSHAVRLESGRRDVFTPHDVTPHNIYTGSGTRHDGMNASSVQVRQPYQSQQYSPTRGFSDYAPGPLSSPPSTSLASVRTSPGLDDSGRPTVPVTYRFVHYTPTSMVVIPNGPAPNPSPLYRISVVSNLFNPGVYITTIQRGGTEDGRYVGHFELDPSTRSGILCVKGTEHKVKDIFTKNSNSTSIWTWKISERLLKWSWKVQGWDSTTASASCYLEPQSRHRQDSHRQTDNPVASFTTVRRSDRSLPKATLEVFPAGQEWLDDILISVLILDRKRLKGEAPS